MPFIELKDIVFDDEQPIDFLELLIFGEDNPFNPPRNAKIGHCRADGPGTLHSQEPVLN